MPDNPDEGGPVRVKVSKSHQRYFDHLDQLKAQGSLLENATLKGVRGEILLSVKAIGSGLKNTPA
jgi:hypothetical protein